jgi:hypothetical protein
MGPAHYGKNMGKNFRDHIVNKTFGQARNILEICYHQLSHYNWATHRMHTFSIQVHTKSRKYLNSIDLYDKLIFPSASQAYYETV